MLILLSPAKKLDFDSPVASPLNTENRFLKEAEQVVSEMKKLTIEEMMKLMHISKPLAQLNYERYQNWMLPFTNETSRQALFAFKGDAYGGLSAEKFSPRDIDYSQQHLRILSALYGLIRPLDLIMPYRIEMGMKRSFGGYKNLYDFWVEKITAAVSNDLQQQSDDILINLASQEYSKAVDFKKLNARVISPVFKEEKNGELKIVSSKAKRARGMMSRFIIQNQITNPDELKLFDMEDYYYNDRLSNPDTPVFIR